MNTAIVTGANKGLGLALVRGLCQRLGPGAHVYLTARDRQRGNAALRALEAEGLTPHFFHLDLTDLSSIQSLAEHLRHRHGGLDLLVQNGAYAACPTSPPRSRRDGWSRPTTSAPTACCRCLPRSCGHRLGSWWWPVASAC